MVELGKVVLYQYNMTIALYTPSNINHIRYIHKGQFSTFIMIVKQPIVFSKEKDL